MSSASFIKYEKQGNPTQKELPVDSAPVSPTVPTSTKGNIISTGVTLNYVKKKKSHQQSPSTPLTKRQIINPPGGPVVVEQPPPTFIPLPISKPKQISSSSSSQQPQSEVSINLPEVKPPSQTINPNHDPVLVPPHSLQTLPKNSPLHVAVKWILSLAPDINNKDKLSDLRDKRFTMPTYREFLSKFKMNRKVHSVVEPNKDSVVVDINNNGGLDAEDAELQITDHTKTEVDKQFLEEVYRLGCDLYHQSITRLLAVDDHYIQNTSLLLSMIGNTPHGDGGANARAKCLEIAFGVYQGTGEGTLDYATHNSVNQGRSNSGVGSVFSSMRSIVKTAFNAPIDLLLYATQPVIIDASKIPANTYIFDGIGDELESMIGCNADLGYKEILKRVSNPTNDEYEDEEDTVKKVQRNGLRNNLDWTHIVSSCAEEILVRTFIYEQETKYFEKIKRTQDDLTNKKADELEEIKKALKSQNEIRMDKVVEEAESLTRGFGSVFGKLANTAVSVFTGPKVGFGSTPISPMDALDRNTGFSNKFGDKSFVTLDKEVRDDEEFVGGDYGEESERGSIIVGDEYIRHHQIQYTTQLVLNMMKQQKLNESVWYKKRSTVFKLLKSASPVNILFAPKQYFQLLGNSKLAYEYMPHIRSQTIRFDIYNPPLANKEYAYSEKPFRNPFNLWYLTKRAERYILFNSNGWWDQSVTETGDDKRLLITPYEEGRTNPSYAWIYNQETGSFACPKETSYAILLNLYEFHLKGMGRLLAQIRSRSNDQLTRFIYSSGSVSSGTNEHKTRKDYHNTLLSRDNDYKKDCFLAQMIFENMSNVLRRIKSIQILINVDARVERIDTTPCNLFTLNSIYKGLVGDTSGTGTEDIQQQRTPPANDNALSKLDIINEKKVSDIFAVKVNTSSYSRNVIMDMKNPLYSTDHTNPIAKIATYINGKHLTSLDHLLMTKAVRFYQQRLKKTEVMDVLFNKDAGVDNFVWFKESQINGSILVSDRSNANAFLSPNSTNQTILTENGSLVYEFNWLARQYPELLRRLLKWYSLPYLIMEESYANVYDHYINEIMAKERQLEEQRHYFHDIGRTTVKTTQSNSTRSPLTNFTTGSNGTTNPYTSQEKPKRRDITEWFGDLTTLQFDYKRLYEGITVGGGDMLFTGLEKA